MNARISGCGGRAPPRRNRGPAKDLVVLPQPLDLALQALDLGRLFARDTGAGPVVDLGLGQPAPHGLPRDTFLASDRGRRRGQGGVLLLVLPHEPHAPRAQLGIDLLRHAVHPLGLKQQRHQTRADSHANRDTEHEPVTVPPEVLKLSTDRDLTAEGR